MSGNEIRISLSIVWLIISFAIFIILIAPFVLPTDTITSLTPTCEWKAKYGKECPLCGMTTGFFLISQGRFSEAFIANEFSLCLYSIFVLNEVAIVLFLTNQMRRR